MTKSQSTRFAEAPLQLELPFGAFSPVDAPAADPDPPAVERQARAEEQTDEQADFVNSYFEDRRIRAAEAHAAFSPHEFGSLQGRTPPGQDPQVLVDLTTRIAEEVRPDNVLDRLLVADIAKDTVLADFLFGGLLDAYACQEEDTARELAASAAAGGEKSGLPAERELRGRACQVNFGRMRGSPVLKVHAAAADAAFQSADAAARKVRRVFLETR